MSEMILGRSGFSTVKTGPCPKCQSFKTEATLRAGVVLLRSCLTCSWTWDHADGVPSQYALSISEREQLRG